MPIGYPTFGAPLGRQRYDPRVTVRGRAGAGGVVPYTAQLGHGSFVRVGPGTPVPRPVAPAAPPPYPPTGTFDPERELSVTEGQRGLEQLEGEGATDQSRWRTDYSTGMGEYDRQHKEQDEGLQKNLAILAESFQKLGTRQQEGANAAGVLQGGALLQAATKRSENEGKEKTKQTEGHDKAVGAIERARSKYSLDYAPPDAGNPLGGRKWQDLATHIRNAQANQAFYQQGNQQVAAQEAAEHGFGGYRTGPAKVQWSRNPQVRVRQMKEIREGKLVA